MCQYSNFLHNNGSEETWQIVILNFIPFRGFLATSLMTQIRSLNSNFSPRRTAGHSCHRNLSLINNLVDPMSFLWFSGSTSTLAVGRSLIQLLIRNIHIYYFSDFPQNRNLIIINLHESLEAEIFTQLPLNTFVDKFGNKDIIASRHHINLFHVYSEFIYS